MIFRNITKRRVYASVWMWILFYVGLVGQNNLLVPKIQLPAELKDAQVKQWEQAMAKEDVEKLVALLDDYLEVAEGAYAKLSPAYADAIRLAGQIHERTGNIDLAEIYYLKNLDIREQVYGEESVERAEAHHALSRVYIVGRDTSMAELHIVAAIRLYQIAKQTSSRVYYSLIHTAKIYFQHIESTKNVESCLIARKEMSSQLFGAHSPEHLSDVEWYTNFLLSRERYWQAEEFLETFLKEIPDNKLKRPQVSQLRSHYEVAFAKAEKDTALRKDGLVLLNEAYDLYKGNQLEEAVSLAKVATSEIRKELGRRSEDYIGPLLVLSQMQIALFSENQDYSIYVEAKSILKECRDFLKQSNGAYPGLAETYNKVIAKLESAHRAYGNGTRPNLDKEASARLDSLYDELPEFTEQDSIRIANLMAEVQEKFKNGQSQDVIEIITPFVTEYELKNQQNDPNYVLLLALLGLSQSSLGLISDAKATLDKYIQFKEPILPLLEAVTSNFSAVDEKVSKTYAYLNDTQIGQYEMSIEWEEKVKQIGEMVTQGDWQSSIDRSLEAYTLSKNWNTSFDAERHLQSINLLLRIYLDMGMHQEMDTYLEEGLALIKGPLIQSPHQEVSLSKLYNLKAQRYFEGPQIEEAIDLLHTSLELFDTEGERSLPEYSETSLLLAEAYLSSNQLKLAEEYLQGGLGKLKRFGEFKSIELAKAYMIDCALKLNKSNFDEASESLEQARHYLLVLLDEHALLYGEYLVMRANLDLITGDIDNVEKALKQAVDIYTTFFGPDHYHVFVTKANLNTFYRSIGQWDRALVIAQDLLRWEVKGANPKILAQEFLMLKVAMAESYLMLGQYPAGVIILEEAMAERDDQDQFSFLSAPMFNKGINLLAEFYFLLSTTYSPESGDAYLNIFSLMSPFSQKEFEKVGPKENPFTVLAGKYFERGYELTKESHSTSSLQYAVASLKIGSYYTFTGDTDRAETLIVQSRSSLKRLFDKNHPLYLQAIYQLAELYHSTNRDRLAEPFYLEANRIVIHLLQSYYPSLNQGERIEFLDKLAVHLNGFSSFAYQRQTLNPIIPADLLNLELATRQLGLNTQRQITNTEQVDDQILLIQNELRAVNKQLEDAYLKPLPSSSAQQNKIDRINDQAKYLYKALTEQQAKQGLAESNRVDWKTIQEQLGGNETAVQFLQFAQPGEENENRENFYFALVVKPNMSIPVFVRITSEKSLTPFRIDAPADNNSYVSKSRKAWALYELIWKPLEAHIDEDDVVYFAPSGLLSKIAYPILKDENGQFLLEKYQLVQTSSIGNLLEMKKETPDNSKSENKKIVALGGPDFNALTGEGPAMERQAGSKNGESWAALSWTKEEVEAIKEAVDGNSDWQIEAFIGKTATEQQLLTVTENAPDVLHIATHGFFLPKKEKRNSWLSGYYFPSIAEENEDLSFVELAQASEEPLLRSGLILSGGNHAWSGSYSGKPSKDGIVTSFDISSLPLNNTQLAVLSACETGLGDVHDREGVLGLQSAFHLAGVDQLIMSLWKIEDYGTFVFMKSFYEKFFTSGNVGDAFLKTQREMITKKVPPYLWGGFILVD